MVNIRTITKKLFGGRGNEVVGLDISPMSVKVIRLKRCGEEIFISGGGKVEISQDMSGSVESKITSTVEAICKCVDISGCQANRAVCAVDAPDVAVSSFCFDPMPADETGYSILMEAEHISPADMDHTIVDYQLVGGYQEGKELKGMLAAARSDAIMDKCHLAERANLETVLVDVDSLALINCFSKFSETDADQVSVIVNLGDSWTNLVVAGGERLPFVRNISYPGSKILHSVACTCGLTELQVRRILFDGDSQDDKYELLRDSLLARMSELVPEISDTLRYCQAREKNCSVERILLCGDFACIDGVAELFEKSLIQRVDLWNPVKIAGFTASVTNRHELEKIGPGMAIAMGLSMRAIKCTR
jgi:type IV pilus assembly protein PilM